MCACAAARVVVGVAGVRLAEPPVERKGLGQGPFQGHSHVHTKWQQQQ